MTARERRPPLGEEEVQQQLVQLIAAGSLRETRAFFDLSRDEKGTVERNEANTRHGREALE